MTSNQRWKKIKTTGINIHDSHKPQLWIRDIDKVRPSKIEYLKTGVHNLYYEELIELIPGMSSFFDLEDV